MKLSDIIQFQQKLQSINQYYNQKENEFAVSINRVFNFLFFDTTILYDPSNYNDEINTIDRTEDDLIQIFYSIYSSLHSNPSFIHCYCHLFELISTNSNFLNSQDEDSAWLKKRRFLNIFTCKKLRKLLSKRKLGIFNEFSQFETNDDFDYPLFNYSREKSLIDTKSTASVSSENNEMIELIKKDDISTFQHLFNNHQIKPTHNSLHIDGFSDPLSIIECAALMGSVRIFSFLYDNHTDYFIKSLKRFAILGECQEIISKLRISVQNDRDRKIMVKYNRLKDDPSVLINFTFHDLKSSVKFYNVELFVRIYSQLDKNNNTNTISPHYILPYAAKYNRFDIVSYLIDDMNVCPFTSLDHSQNIFKARRKSQLQIPARTDNKPVPVCINTKNPITHSVLIKRVYETQSILYIAENGNLSLFEHFLNFYTNIETTSNEYIDVGTIIEEVTGESLIHKACRGGNLAILQTVISLYSNKSADNWWKEIPNEGKNKNLETPLHIASRFGYSDLVSLLLSVMPIDMIFAADKHKMTAFHVSIRYGRLDITKKLFDYWNQNQESHSWDVPTKFGITPFLFAAHEGQIEILKFLISFDSISETCQCNEQLSTIFKRDAFASKSCSALLLSVLWEYPEMAQFLSALPGVPKNAADKYGQTAIHAAYQHKLYNLVKFFLSEEGRNYGFDVNSRNAKKKTVLHLSASTNNLDMVKFLIETVGTIQQKGQTEQAHQCISCNHDNISLAHNCSCSICFHRKIMKKASSRSNLNLATMYFEQENPKECGCLCCCCPICYRRTCFSNPSLYTDINARDGHFLTAFQIACNKSHLEIASYLAEHGADVNSQGEDDWTALHFAAQQNNVETLRFLTQLKQIDLNIKASFGITPLYLAAFNGSLDALRYLLQECPRNKEIDILSRDDANCTLFHAAASSNQINIVDFILNKYTPRNINISDLINATNCDNMTALHMAARENYLEIVKLILSDQRVDVSIVDSQDKKAWDYLTPENQLLLKAMFEKAEESPTKCEIF